MAELSLRQKLPRGGRLRSPMEADLGGRSLSLRAFLSPRSPERFGFIVPPPDGAGAVVLSGGGAKGSFEVGALHLLAESGYLEALNVRVVSGSSVGSVNALKLAERPGRETTQTILEMWLGLDGENSMYATEPWVNQVIALVPELGPAFQQLRTPEWLQRGREDDDSIVPQELYVGLGAVAGAPGLVALGMLLFAHARLRKIDRAWEIAREGKNLFSLTPVMEKLRHAVDFDAVRSSNVALRLVAVDLVSGSPAYIGNDLKIRQPGRTNDPGAPFDWSKSSETAITKIEGHSEADEILLRATIASAAIPGVFPRQEIEAGVASGVYVDGGVRDVLPLHAATHALDDAAANVPVSRQTVISVSAGPVEVSSGTESLEWGDPRFPSRANYLDQMGRSLGIMLSEIHRQDAQPDFGLNDERTHVHVAPQVVVHGTTEVSPGLLRINMAYGYMRAFDELRVRNGMLAREAKSLRKNSHEITRKRRNVYRGEVTLPLRVISGSTSSIAVADADGLERLRRSKAEVAQLVEARIQRWGPESVPLRLEADPPRPIDRWWRDWERHRPTGRGHRVYEHFDYQEPIRVVKVSGEVTLIEEESDASFALADVRLDPAVEAHVSRVP